MIYLLHVYIYMYIWPFTQNFMSSFPCSFVVPLTIEYYLNFNRFDKKPSIFSSLIFCYLTISCPQLLKHAALGVGEKMADNTKISFNYKAKKKTKLPVFSCEQYNSKAYKTKLIISLLSLPFHFHPLRWPVLTIWHLFVYFFLFSLFMIHTNTHTCGRFSLKYFQMKLYGLCLKLFICLVWFAWKKSLTHTYILSHK